MMKNLRAGSMWGAVVLTGGVCLGGGNLKAEEVKLTVEQRNFFEGKIRPILSENCYKCHSVEQGKKKGDLTLDTREGLLQGGEDGVVIVPGDPEASLLIKAVRYLDPDLKMPPSEGGGKKLSDAQIASLVDWVKMGVPDPRSGTELAKLTGLTDRARSHWAYQPIQKINPPAVKNKNWVATPVDAFILAKLDKNNMGPARQTSKEALLRRATYDLIGLPPTPAEVFAFVSDHSPYAFARVVDRLLASPHYGERWGRFWLDTARYADTRGNDNNGTPDEYRYPYAWTYRDYVIRSFNEDKPYDQFIIEQLAADKLLAESKQEGAPDDKSILAALGFLTVGQRFNNPNDVINDRLDVVTKGFLGMTVTCARCHDHKFDPIPTRDYYSLHGVFASSVEPYEKPLLQPIRTTTAYLDYRKKRLEMEQHDRDLYYRMLDEMLEDFRQNVAGYLLSLEKPRDKMVAGANPLPSNPPPARPMVLDDELQRIVLNRVRRRDDPVFEPFRAYAEIKAEEFRDKSKEIAATLARNKKLNPIVAEAFRGLTPASLSDVAAVYKRIFESINSQGKAFIEANRLATTATLPGYESERRQLLQVPFLVKTASELSTAKLSELVQNWPRKRFQKEGGFNFAKINELELTHPGTPPRAMVLNDAPKPHDSAVLIRGEAQHPGPVVSRQFLEILAGPNRKPFTEGSGRLELARAIASKENPLTARVIVNRVWMHHFGDGLVLTLDDLGTQSEPPSHPELLDYLAARLMEEGWSLKKMHRLIMLSSVYQQTSDTDEAKEMQDPNNRLLWRANLRRLDFEAQRDSLLVFSGKLDSTMGGQPVNITDEPYSLRRSVYGYIDRGNLPELMLHFDFSDPDMPNSKRRTTVVPQQALFFMNSPFVVDVARKIVARPDVVFAAGDVGRIVALHKIIYQRPPRLEEIQLGQAFLELEKQDHVPLNPVAAKIEQGKQDAQALGETSKKNASPAAPKKDVAKKAKGPEGRRPIENPGEIVERRPMTVWEEYTQALLLANEAAYVN